MTDTQTPEDRDAAIRASVTLVNLDRELEAVAFHEAGHSAVCHHLGGYGYISIWPNESGHNDEKSWLGQFVTVSRPRTPKRWRVLIGLAGLVAEYMLRNPTTEAREPRDCAMEISDLIFMGGASESDLELIGPRWSQRDVARVLQILGICWQSVEFEAALRIHLAQDAAKV